MCSLAVSTQDSPAVEPRSNPGSGKILMSEILRLYTTSGSFHVKSPNALNGSDPDFDENAYIWSL